MIDIPRHYDTISGSREEKNMTFGEKLYLSTIRDSDLIILLEKVEIAEQGTHEEMMALGGR